MHGIIKNKGACISSKILFLFDYQNKGSMTKINLQQTLRKPFSEWTDDEKIIFLHDLLDHHKRPLPGYSETMLDKIIFSPDDRLAYRMSKE